MSTPEKPGKETLALSKAAAAEEREREGIERERGRAERELQEAKDRAAAAEAERKNAEANRIATLEKELENERVEKDSLEKKNSKLVWWFLGITVSGSMLLLLFIGAMIGVVKSGDVNIPGIGNVKIGAQGKPEPVEQPVDEPTTDGTSE